MSVRHKQQFTYGPKESLWESQAIGGDVDNQKIISIAEDVTPQDNLAFPVNDIDFNLASPSVRVWNYGKRTSNQLHVETMTPALTGPGYLSTEFWLWTPNQIFDFSSPWELTLTTSPYIEALGDWFIHRVDQSSNIFLVRALLKVAVKSASSWVNLSLTLRVTPISSKQTIWGYTRVDIDVNRVTTRALHNVKETVGDDWSWFSGSLSDDETDWNVV